MSRRKKNIIDEQSEPQQIAPVAEIPTPAPQPGSETTDTDGGAPSATSEAGSPAGDPVSLEVPSVTKPLPASHQMTEAEKRFNRMGPINADPEPSKDPHAGDKDANWLRWCRDHAPARFNALSPNVKKIIE